MHSAVDAFFNKERQWLPEMKQMRKIALACKLEENIKWGLPCYSFQGKNIVIIQDFKAYCAYLFFKGVLLSDPQKILVKTGANTMVGRQVRFTNARDITSLAETLRQYIYEAIEVERSGLKVPVKKSAALALPDEFKTKLDKTPALKKAFAALTPGRQKAYIIHFSSAKQAATREARVEKALNQILSGKGLNE